MLQRIQSIYLILSFLLSVTGIYLFGREWVEADFFGILGSVIASSFLSFFVVFFFKKRPFQIRLNQLNLLLNLSIIGLLTYRLLNFPEDIHFPDKATELVIPLIISVLIMVLLWLANLAIKKDDRLIKSVDRIR